MLRSFSILLLCLELLGCGETHNTPVDFKALGYRTCQGYFDCGSGRYCSDDGTCWADCRNSADCARLGEGFVCNRYGQCLEQEQETTCTRHEECGEGRYCNGNCSTTGALCGSPEDCPLQTGEDCQGTCSIHCGTENDCSRETECTPVGQCLLPGWELWIPPGEIPPLTCRTDAQCKSLGWSWICDCEKADHDYLGQACRDGGESLCVQGQPIDFGDPPADSPAYGMPGVFGMRTQAAIVLSGLPIINVQNSYMSSLALMKVTYMGGNTLKLENRECDIDLISFNDDDTPPLRLGWMLIPHAYLHSLPVREQTGEAYWTDDGANLDLSVLVEARGVKLDDPLNDPVPDHTDYQQNPDDPRFWDQDRDGQVGMTMLQDGMVRGRIYHIQRARSFPSGITRVDDDHVRGNLTVYVDLKYIETSIPHLFGEIESVMHEEADRSFFRHMRMPDDANCADLIREGSRDDSWLRHTNHLMDVPDP